MRTSLSTSVYGRPPAEVDLFAREQEVSTRKTRRYLISPLKQASEPHFKDLIFASALVTMLSGSGE